MKLLQKSNRTHTLRTRLRRWLLAAPLTALLASPWAWSQTGQAPRTDIAQQLFTEAMEKRDSGDVFTAIELFEALLAANPALNRARLELAVAYHQATRYQDAIKELQTVLDAPDTPENVRLSILAYLGQVSQDEKKPEGEHSLSYYLKAGLLNNSNLNASQAISTGLNTAGPTELASVGSDLVLNVAHRYSRKRLLNLAGNTAAFEWQSQATLSSNSYLEDQRFNLHILSLSTGPVFIAPGRWRVNATLQADAIVLGSDTLATFASFSPAIKFDLGSYRSIALESTFTTHTYSDAGNAGYDGSEILFGIGYAMYLPKADTGFELGLRNSSNDAEDDAFSYDLQEIYATGFHSLSAQSSLYLRLSTRGYEYVALDPTVGVIRDETERYVALGFNHDHQQGWLKDWVMNIEFSVVDSDSNADSLDYRRQLIGISWSRSFR